MLDEPFYAPLGEPLDAGPDAPLPLDADGLPGLDVLIVASAA